MIRPSALAVAGLAGLVLTASATLVVLSGVAGDPPQPQDLLPALVAAAGLCVAALLRRRSPSGAWLATIAALTVATLSIAIWGRESRAGLQDSEWTLLVATFCVGALFRRGPPCAMRPNRPDPGGLGPSAGRRRDGRGGRHVRLGDPDRG